MRAQPSLDIGVRKIEPIGPLDPKIVENNKKGPYDDEEEGHDKATKRQKDQLYNNNNTN